MLACEPPEAVAIVAGALTSTLTLPAAELGVGSAYGLETCLAAGIVVEGGCIADSEGDGEGEGTCICDPAEPIDRATDVPGAVVRSRSLAGATANPAPPFAGAAASCVGCPASGVGLLLLALPLVWKSFLMAFTVTVVRPSMPEATTRALGTGTLARSL